MTPNFREDPFTVEAYISGRVFSEADEFVADRLEDLRPESLLELGTGPGILVKNSSFIRNYFATDLSFEFLKRLPALPAVCCTACSLPVRSNTMHCVLAMAVLHHLSRTGLQDAIRETRRVLKPGGAFIILEDWCFSRGDTPFEEEARKLRFRYGTKENHLAEGTWLIELQASGFRCRERTWVRRPFHTTSQRLLQWPENERVVRMLYLEMEKTP